MFRLAVLAALPAIAGAPPLAAQTTLTGSVEGPDGEPLVGARARMRMAD